ncbi:MAG: T9SS type A sorting domain-containing protein [Ginsengibacter sp.]
MKGKIILILIAIFLVAKPIKIIAQVNIQDSLALVDYYDSTYGVSPWQFGQSWDLQQPVSTWIGIGIKNNRVASITLRGGGHGGHIPSSFGNLTALESIDYLDFMMDATLPESFENLVNLTTVYFHAVFYMVPFPAALTKVPNLKSIDMEDNYFTDGLPPSMGTMKKLETLNLFQNSLSGSIPTDLNSLPSLNFMDISYNKYTFKDISPFVNNYVTSGKTYSLNYAPQGNITIHHYQDKLAVSAGGNLSDDTFKWLKDSILVATNKNDSTFSPTEPGKYYVEVTNSIATDLMLYADEMMVNYQLPISTIEATKDIAGTDTTYITDGIFKIAALKPLPGGNALNGNVSTTVSINSSVPTFHSQPFVQRHYDIMPAVNAANAEAIVVLYFTQQDFDNYNNYVTTNNLNLPLLPSGGTDNGNIRITQFHGTFAGSSNPENYLNQNFVLIKPNVQWDIVNNWWVVTFPVSGFSGFFVNTVNSALPLTLLQFNGVKEKNLIKLRWQTVDEINTRQFNVQHSNGNGFRDIGTISAQSIKGTNNYAFTDENPNTGNNLYRLKMTDVDGIFTYSNVITINFNGNKTSLKLYPNPVSSILHLKIVSEKSENIKLKITDALGKSVYRKIISVNAGDNSQNLNIQNLPPGTYFLNVNQNGKIEKIGFVKE